MARYFVLAFLVLFAICLMQVTAEEDPKASEQSNIQDELKKAGEKISEAFKDAKPKIDELLAKGQEFFEGVGKKFSEEAAKIIPKNGDEKKP